MDCDGEIGADDCVHVGSNIEKHVESIGTSNTAEPCPVMYEAQSSKRKVVPKEKIHEYVRMRRKLLQRLEELEQREVSFEDEAKEKFYINNELKIKKSILEIEKILYNSDALTELDEDLRAFHSKTPRVDFTVLDTGNELLNQRLTEFIAKNASQMIITPNFDELSSIMREVREQQGNLSNIPDPELDSAAFLDSLENVAFVAARSHQKLVSRQFLDRLDMYVPKAERQLCCTPPEISSDLRKLLTAEAAANNLSDDVFRMEMRKAGRFEQQNPDEVTYGDEIDITNESVSDIDDDEDEGEESEEEEESRKGDVHTEDNGCKSTGEDSVSLLELRDCKRVIIPTSLRTGYTDVVDIAGVEYKTITGSKSACQGSQVSSARRPYEDKNSGRRNNQQSKILDIICIDD